MERKLGIYILGVVVGRSVRHEVLGCSLWRVVHRESSLERHRSKMIRRCPRDDGSFEKDFFNNTAVWSFLRQLCKISPCCCPLLRFLWETSSSEVVGDSDSDCPPIMPMPPLWRAVAVSVLGGRSPFPYFVEGGRRLLVSRKWLQMVLVLVFFLGGVPAHGS